MLALRKQEIASKPQLGLVAMPTATYIGTLYETPQQRNPQEPPIAELYRVTRLDKENGVYAVPVTTYESPKVICAFLSQAKKVTGRLPERKAGKNTYGLNELSFFPENLESSLDLREKPALHRTIQKGFLRHHAVFPLEFA